MARLEITITGQNGGQPLLKERFELSPELARALILKLEGMLADLPGRPVSRTLSRNGVTVFELDLRRPPPVVSPTFQELYRLSTRKEKSDVKETS